jgi:hypothetical protein
MCCQNARGILSFGSLFLILTPRFAFFPKAIVRVPLGTSNGGPGCNARLYHVFRRVCSILAAGTRDWALNC